MVSKAKQSFKSSVHLTIINSEVRSQRATGLLVHHNIFDYMVVNACKHSKVFSQNFEIYFFYSDMNAEMDWTRDRRCPCKVRSGDKKSITSWILCEHLDPVLNLTEKLAGK